VGASCEEECQGGAIILTSFSSKSTPPQPHDPRLLPHPLSQAKGMDSSRRDPVEEAAHVVCVMESNIHKRLHRRKPHYDAQQSISLFYDLLRIHFTTFSTALYIRLRLHGDALDRFCFCLPRCISCIESMVGVWSSFSD
jgi:hypothetical protein